MIRTGSWTGIIFLLCILLAGCGQNELQTETESHVTEVIVPKEIEVEAEPEERIEEMRSKDEKELLEVEELKGEGETEYINKGNLDVPIDYDFLAENHEILEYNICISPISVYDHSVLREYLKEYLEFDQDFNKKFGAFPAPKEYFIFDFNGDGLEDYMVCFAGIPWGGVSGNSLMIYVQEEDGVLKQVFSVSAQNHQQDGANGHAPVVVLNERTEGYYALVLPWTQNRVWSYDREQGRYDTYKYADED